MCAKTHLGSHLLAPYSPPSNYTLPLHAQLDWRQAPRWDRTAFSPLPAEAPRPWFPFESGADDWPMALALLVEQRVGNARILMLEVTYPYGHDPLMEQWTLTFQGFTSRTEEPCGLPGNHPLLKPPARGNRKPVLWEIVHSRWLPALGAVGRPPETLRHFVLQLAPEEIWHIAAQRCVAQRQALRQERNDATTSAGM